MKSTVIVLALLLLAQFASLSYGIRYLDLNGTNPVGIIYDGNRKCVWVAIEGSNKVAQIDAIDGKVDYYPVPQPRRLALDPDGNLWIANRFNQGVYKLLVDSNATEFYNMTLIGNDGAFDVAYLNGEVWVAGWSGFYRFSYKDGNFLAFTPYGYTYLSSMVVDGDCIWYGMYDENMVCRLDTLKGEVTANVSTIECPWGMTVDEKYVYVAEFVWSDDPHYIGKVARIDKETLEKSELETLPTAGGHGPVTVFKDSKGYLWYVGLDAEGAPEHVGIVGGVDYGINISNSLVQGATEVSYTLEAEGMATTTVNEIWFAVKGSAHVAVTETGTLGRMDINKDGKVDVVDVAVVCRHFGQLVGNPGWLEEADINQDGKVDVQDVARVCRLFGTVMG